FISLTILTKLTLINSILLANLAISFFPSKEIFFDKSPEDIVEILSPSFFKGVISVFFNRYHEKKTKNKDIARKQTKKIRLALYAFSWFIYCCCKSSFKSPIYITKLSKKESCIFCVGCFIADLISPAERKLHNSMSELCSCLNFLSNSLNELSLLCFCFKISH